MSARSQLLRAGERLADLVALPAFAVMRILTPALGASEAFRAVAETVAGVPGPLGLLVRRRFYARVLPHMGRNVSIGYGSILVHPTAALDDDVYIGRYCLIGDARVGAGTMLADYARVVSGQHGLEAGQRIRDLPNTYRTVTIGSEAWIANGAIVMADVGDGAVVAAGSVVTRPVEPGHIVAGNPARVLRDREAAA